MRGIDLLVLAFVSLLLIPSASGASIWKGLLDRPIYYINIDGDATLRNWTPPLNPFNDSSITWINIGYEYNETHTFNKYYEGGKWKEGFFSKHGNPKPFNLSDWNLSKVLKEYQWGVVNYLPNISGKFSAGEWEKGHWNSTIEKWNAIIASNHLQITLHTFACGGSGECDEYITFECWRNGTNVTCKWGKPVFKTYPGPPVNGKIPGKETKTSSTSTKAKTTSTTSRTVTTSTTSRTTSTPSSTQGTTSTEERKLCGPGLLIGLVLLPVLLRWRLNGRK